MKKVSHYILATSALLSTFANADLNGDGDISIVDTGDGMGLSGDLPGLLALGAVALVAGIQIARRNKRK